MVSHPSSFKRTWGKGAKAWTSAWFNGVQPTLDFPSFSYRSEETLRKWVKSFWHPTLFIRRPTTSEYALFQRLCSLSLIEVALHHDNKETHNNIPLMDVEPDIGMAQTVPCFTEKWQTLSYHFLCQRVLFDLLQRTMSMLMVISFTLNEGKWR